MEIFFIDIYKDFPNGKEKIKSNKYIYFKKKIIIYNLFYKYNVKFLLTFPNGKYQI